MPNLLGNISQVMDTISNNLKSMIPSDPSIQSRPRQPSRMTVTNVRSPQTPFLGKMTQPYRLNQTAVRSQPMQAQPFSNSRPAPLYGIKSFNKALNPLPGLPRGFAQVAPNAASPPPRSGQVTGEYDDRLKGTEQWNTLLQRVSSEAQIPWQVLAAIMAIETGGVNQNDPGGAVGLMQIMPQYWQALANKYGGNLSDPYVNIRTAADILNQNYAKYGSWEKAAAAYFGGGGAFNADGSYSDNSDRYNTTIQDYANRFNSYMQALGYGNPSAAEILNGGAPSSATAGNALSAVVSAIGTPYIWGGSSRGGFDCSGLIQWAYAQSGQQVARTAQEQYNTTQRISSADLMPGDLVFFTGTTNSGVPVTHVGMYLGNGQMIHAPKEGDVVKITSINDPYWQQHLYGFGRVLTY